MCRPSRRVNEFLLIPVSEKWSKHSNRCPPACREVPNSFGPGGTSVRVKLNRGLLKGWRDGEHLSGFPSADPSTVLLPAGPLGNCGTPCVWWPWVLAAGPASSWTLGGWHTPNLSGRSSSWAAGTGRRRGLFCSKPLEIFQCRLITCASQEAGHACSRISYDPSISPDRSLMSECSARTGLLTWVHSVSKGSFLGCLSRCMFSDVKIKCLVSNLAS